MKKLEKLTPDFAECTLSSKEMNLVKGGFCAPGDATVHTSRTTGMKYEDRMNAQNEKVVDYNKPIPPSKQG